MSYRYNKVAARALTPQEVESILRAFLGPQEHRNRAMFVFLVRTGFRISEALSIYVQDVYKDGKIVEAVSVTKRNMKGKNRSRLVYLHEEAKVAILKYLEASGRRVGKLFDLTRGRAASILSTAFISAGVTDAHGTHACRKTFCQNVYRRLKGDILATASVMGHRSIASTQAYLAVDEDKARAAVLGTD